MNYMYHKITANTTIDANMGYRKMKQRMRKNLSEKTRYRFHSLNNRQKQQEFVLCNFNKEGALSQSVVEG